MLVVWLLGVVVSSVRTRREVRGERDPADRRAPTHPEYGKPCPLCGTPLRKGERVHSVVYPAPGESFVEIYGCPHCEPARRRRGSEGAQAAPTAGRRPRGREGAAPAGDPPHGARRRCPVCRRTLEEDGYLVGRMQERNGIRHLRILGCTGCRTVR